MLIEDEDVRTTLKEFVHQVAVLDIYYHLLVELNPPPSHKHYRVIMSSPSVFPRAVRVAVYSHVVMLLSKLFYKRDGDITLHTLLKKVISNYTKLELKREVLSEQDAKALLTEVESHVSTINRLKTQRNKFVAHNDKEFFGEPNKVAELTLEFSEMTTLLVLARRVVSSINLAYGDHFQFRGQVQAQYDIEHFFGKILDHDKWLIEEEQRDIEAVRRRGTRN